MSKMRTAEEWATRHGCGCSDWALTKLHPPHESGCRLDIMTDRADAIQRNVIEAVACLVAENGRVGRITTAADIRELMAGEEPL